VVVIQKYTCKWMARHVYFKLLSATIFIQCYRQLRAKKELQRLKQKAKELSIKPVGDSRTNHIEEKGNDTTWAMKKQSDSDSNVKYVIVQFYNNSHNSQSERWIGLKLYVESLDMFSYHELKFQVNWSSKRHHNTSQQGLYCWESKNNWIHGVILILLVRESMIVW